MNTTDARVLAILAPGGQLTLDQIAKDAGISVRRVKRSVQSLTRTGMVWDNVGMHRDACSITPGGACFAATRRGRAVLDAPPAAS
ncbi:helix-turn-helix domain-containing protein [Nocardia tengchongensis]